MDLHYMRVGYNQGRIQEFQKGRAIAQFSATPSERRQGSGLREYYQIGII